MGKGRHHTLTEIAELAGVSLSTVSRVMNGRPGVSEDVSRRVQEVLEEHHMRASAAVSLRVELERVVSVVIPDGGNPFFHSILSGAEEIGRRHGYHLLYYNSRNDASCERENFDSILSSQVQGVLLVSQTSKGGSAERLIHGGKKVVLADRLVEGLRVPSVVTNNENGAYQAARYLLNLGHRRILYMGGDTQLSTENSRLRGFRRAMEEVGAEVDPALVVEESFDSDSAYRRVRSILADGQWRGAKMFTAVFCVDDVIAFGVKAAVENLGLAVPADVSIVGFDDIAFAGYLGLTTVAQPAVEMGRNAMILLVDALEGRLEEEDYTMVLEPSLIIRATCGRPRTVGSSAG